MDPKDANLNPSLFTEYFQNIMEHGGAPSITEIEAFTQKIARSSQAVATTFTNQNASLSNVMNQVQSFIRLGQLEKAREVLLKEKNALFRNQLENLPSKTKEIEELQFMIETFLFAGHFNSAFVQTLRQNYISKLTNEGGRRQSNQFLEFAS